MASQQKTTTPALVPDDSLTDAQLDRFEQRKRERERIEKIRAAGNLATEERIIIRMGQPVPVGNILRPSEHALAEDRVKFPAGAMVTDLAAIGFVGLSKQFGTTGTLSSTRRRSIAYRRFSPAARKP